MADKAYDVAISFLHRDEPLALELEARLTEQYEVFVYSKKQEKLAGSDGLESFREAFVTQSRLVVVLYREGWGETPWTRVEQAAIKDRFLAEGWEFLLFVSLTDKDKVPVWLPSTDIRLSFEQYGVEQLVGAIKVRATKVGAVAHPESPAERAKRLALESSLRAKRQHLLDADGGQALNNEFATIGERFVAMCEDANNELDVFQIQARCCGRECGARGRLASIHFYAYLSHPTTDCRIVVNDYVGPLRLPGEAYTSERRVQEVGETRYYLDFQHSYGWCWHEKNSSMYLSSEGLAGDLLKRFLDVEDRADRGDFTRR